MQRITIALVIALSSLLQVSVCRAVEVLTEIESGKIVDKTQWIEADKRLRLTLKNDIPNHWFLFALRGVKDKTLTIEIAAQNTIHGTYPWKDVQPVMADQIDTSDPLLYDEAAYQAQNGRLPWRRIKNATYDEKARVLTTKVSFDRDEATIALKYPAPISYVARRLQQLQEQNLDFQILEAGQSKAKRPLQVLAVPKFSVNKERWKTKPVILLYAGEHATEHDAPHAIIGALQWLLGESAEARALREKCNVLLIPHLTPDDVVNSIFGRTNNGFMGDEYSYDVENVAWAKFWNRWIENGYPLDISLAIYNVAGAESPNFFSPLVQGYKTQPDYPLSQALHRAIVERVDTLGMIIDTPMGRTGNFPMRLMGWHNYVFGTRAAFYEINSQYPFHPLSLSEVHELGVAILRGTGDFILQPENFRQQREIQRQRLQKRTAKKHEIMGDYRPGTEPDAAAENSKEEINDTFNLLW